MQRVVVWLLGLTVTAILIWGFSSLFGKVIVRYAGEKVIAIITEVPSRCDRYNHIEVLLDGTEYEISISKDNCRKGIYKLGQRVELLKYKNYKELVWPSSHPELAIIAIIIVLFFGFFSIRKKYLKK
jgi:hypothetical protein